MGFCALKARHPVKKLWTMRITDLVGIRCVGSEMWYNIVWRNNGIMTQQITFSHYMVSDKNSLSLSSKDCVHWRPSAGWNLLIVFLWKKISSGLIPINFFIHWMFSFLFPTPPFITIDNIKFSLLINRNKLSYIFFIILDLFFFKYYF